MTGDLEEYLRRLLEVTRSQSAVQSELSSMTLISLGALDALVAAGQLDAEEAARWSERFRGARRDDQDSSSIGLELGATLGSLAIKIPTANLSTLERSIVVNKALQSLFVFSIELYDDGLSLTW